MFIENKFIIITPELSGVMFAIFKELIYNSYKYFCFFDPYFDRVIFHHEFF